MARAKGGHGFLRVHVEMMLTVCRWYSSAPDVRTLTASEIRVFYDGLRGELKKSTKPKG